MVLLEERVWFSVIDTTHRIQWHGRETNRHRKSGWRVEWLSRQKINFHDSMTSEIDFSLMSSMRALCELLPHADCRLCTIAYRRVSYLPVWHQFYWLMKLSITASMYITHNTHTAYIRVYRRKPNLFNLMYNLYSGYSILDQSFANWRLKPFIQLYYIYT